MKSMIDMRIKLDMVKDILFGSDRMILLDCVSLIKAVSIAMKDIKPKRGPSKTRKENK